MADGATTKFKVDISELKAGIQEANRQIKLANAQFKAASSGMENWAESADGVSAKLKQLETVLANENKKLDSLEEQLKLTAERFGENSKEADEMRIKVANQQAVVNKTTKEFQKFSQKLKDIETAQEECADSAEEQAEAMKDVGDSAKKQESALKSLDDVNKKVSDGFTVMKGAIANLIADGFNSLVGAIGNAVESSREYRTEMSKLDSAFADSDVATHQAKDTYEEFYSVLGDSGQAVEAVSFLSELAHNQQDLNKWTTIATGVYGKFGASLPIEGLTEASNETAKTGQVTGALADALNWGAKEGEKFGVKMKANTKENEEWNKAVSEAKTAEDYFNLALSECTSEQERQKLIMNTLNGMYSESAQTFKESNKEVIASNKATQELAETQAELGAKVEPVVTSVKQGFADLLAEILKLTSDVDFSAISGGIEGAFKGFKENILPVIIDGLKWIAEHSEIVKAAIVGIGTAFAVWKVVGLITGVINAYKAFKVAQEGATIGQWLLNKAMNANPIGIIITLISALVAAFIYLWKNCESFRKFFINMWQNIKKIVSEVAAFFKQTFEKIGKFFVDFWNRVKNLANDALQGVKNIWSVITGFFKGLIDAVVGFFANLWQGIKDGAKAGIDGVKNTWNSITGWFSDKISAVSNYFSNMWKNVKNGAKNAWQGIKDTFSKVGSFFKNTFKNAWEGVVSVFSTVGEIFVDIKDGIVTAFKTVVNGLIKGINTVVSLPFKGLNAVLDKIQGVSIAGVKPFNFLSWRAPIPQIPQLAEGAVVRKGKQYLLEGAGDEAVVPLHNNKKWISKTAKDLKNALENEGALGFGNMSSVTNYNFTQNNNSPKALSRLEIYRQTKNQLNFAKGV